MSVARPIGPSARVMTVAAVALAACFGTGARAQSADTAPPGAPSTAAPPSGAPGNGTATAVPIRIEAPPNIAEVLSEFLRRPALTPSPATQTRVAGRLERDTRELMQALGYFSAVVSVAFADDGAIDLKVEPGPRTTVAEVAIRYSGAIAAPDYEQRRSRLAEGFGMQRGAAFISADWESAKQRLLAAVRGEQFLHAGINASKAAVDVAAARARLEIDIDSGPPVEIGRTVFVGLERYPEPVVRELIGLQVGTPYSARLLREVQQVLQRTGWFTSVTVLPIEARDDPAARTDVEIALSERARREFTAGVGYSTDDGARARAAIEDRNLLGRGLLGRAGLVWSQTGTELSLNAREPYDRDGTAHGAQALLSTHRVQSEDVRSLALSAFRSHRRGDYETVLSLAYQFERRKLPDTPAEQFRALVPGFAWSWRSLDDPLLPRSGYSLYAQLSGAARPLLSDTSFLRGYLRGLALLPLPSDNLLLVRGELGAVFARVGDRVPTENLFRTGGSLSVRGYEYQSLGIERSGAIVGGQVLAVASVELQHSLARFGAPDFGLAAFVDVGGVADHVSDLRPSLGFGVGVRWRTPVGPINVDLAYGRDAKRLRLHFTVGYAF